MPRTPHGHGARRMDGLTARKARCATTPSSPSINGIERFGGCVRVWSRMGVRDHTGSPVTAAPHPAGTGVPGTLAHRGRPPPWGTTAAVTGRGNPKQVTCHHTQVAAPLSLAHARRLSSGSTRQKPTGGPKGARAFRPTPPKDPQDFPTTHITHERNAHEHHPPNALPGCTNHHPTHPERHRGNHANRRFRTHYHHGHGPAHIQTSRRHHLTPPATAAPRATANRWESASRGT